MATTQRAERDAWRGVAAEDVDDLPSDLSALLRRRSVRLLGSVAAPHRWRLLAAAALIAVRTGASLSIPYLAGQAIDTGVGGRNVRLLELYAGLIAVAAIVSAL